MQIATNISPLELWGLDAEQVWCTNAAYTHLERMGLADTKRTAERRLQSLDFLPAELHSQHLRSVHDRPLNRLVLNWALEQARKKRSRILFAQLHPLPNAKPCLHINDARGARFWVPMAKEDSATVASALERLQQHVGKPIVLFPHGALVEYLRNAALPTTVSWCPQAYPAKLNDSHFTQATRRSHMPMSTSPHLKRLEAESIHIMREAVAEAQNPAMLYSIGKDSSVMLHLARKAFYPGVPPFPLLHVDTRWKFQEMYQFRDRVAQESGMQLLVHINPEAIEKNINPFDHGSALHTDITKTEGLKQALNKYQFDVVFGGARRDEERSRAKERVFSFRTTSHRWDPKNQRPELWNLYNTRKNAGESIRVFPLSNWTELDIWQYIHQEGIPVVPLYFAAPRPVVMRPGMIMLVDDDRCKLLPGEEIQIRKVRFRTLGCYPLTGAIESEAETLEDILLELINARQSERQGRKIDTDSTGSMEKKKQEGYF
jgi:sulfate adenylyltransferase subunit 2